jgi:hypothetical protein
MADMHLKPLPFLLKCGLIILSCACPGLPVTATTTVLLDEPFTDLSNWSDLSTAVSWSGAPIDGSAFDIASDVLQMDPAAMTAPMWGATGIRSFSAIDFPFPAVVNHATNTVTVDFRLRFEVVGTTGESNRVALMLIHDYPEGGLDLTPDARVGDFTDDWFGRPAYQVRIRGGFNPPDAAPYMMYGGGLDQDGEFEKQKDGETPLYWLPGFVSAAGGTSPGGSPVDNYPLSSWVMGTSAPASTTFKRYRYVVEPNLQSLWVNHADDGVDYVKILEMPLPFEEDAPTDPAPPLYRYFTAFEGLRIYFRSAGTGNINNQVYLDSVKVTVDGDFQLEEPTLITMNNTSGDYLLVDHDDSNLVTYRFSGTVKNYPTSLETIGLRYTGGIRESAANLTISDGNGSPTAGATGAGTVVHFRGLMEGDGFNTFARLVLLDNAKWIVEPEADMNLILDGSLFTRQLWVYGDGTGTLEFAEGFVSDETQNGTTGDGIASVRLSNNTFITHHTQSLPVAPRPDGSGGLQINGHLVFENLPGSTWITRTNAQTYTGAVWLGVDATVQTDTDLTHAGITQFSSHSGSYWAANAFQTTAENVRIDKTGTADLIFEEETAFLPGSLLVVNEGGLVLRSNPASGYMKASPTTMAGPNLNLQSLATTTVEVDTPLTEVASLDLQGSLVLEAQPDGTFPLITTTGDAFLNGSLILRNSGSYVLDTSPAALVSPAGTLDSTGLSVIDETGTGFDYSVSDGSLYLELPDPFTGRDPKFFYYVSDGRLVYLGMGDPWTAGSEVPLVEWRLDSPAPLWQEPQPGAVGTWSVGYSAGEAFWTDTSDTGTHGRHHVATFPAGLDETDFSDVDVTFAGGHTSTVPVYVIRRGVVINEDWSDGAFDSPGWDMVSDPDIGFFSTGRADPPMGLARYLDYFIWPVAYFHTDHFGAGPEDVLILKMSTFSDVAFNNAEYAKPEVAALHDNPDHQFGHDHAAEISRHYYTLSGANQVRPSVDNTEVSLSSIHHAGGSTAATLENTDTTLGVFRTVTGGTQIETYGEISKVEVTINKFLMEDNFIQISIPRSYDASKAPVHRAGTNAGNSLVGMSYAHVGVTARTDTNLDYATDAYDFMYLNSYYGLSSTQLQSGDINNDGSSDADDLALLLADFGSSHNAGGRMAPLADVALDDLPGSGTPPSVAFNETTGELLLVPNGTRVSAVVIPGGPAPVSTNAGLVWSGDWRAATMPDSLHWIDASRLGVTVPVLLATFAPGTTTADFADAHVGYGPGGADTVAIGSTTLNVMPLQALAIAGSGGALQVSFGTQPGFVYQLQSNPDLGASWTDFGLPISGDGTVEVVAIPDPEPGDAAFYRVEIFQQP